MTIYNSDYTYHVSMHILDGANLMPDISKDIFNTDVLHDVDFDEILDYIENWKHYVGDFFNPEQEEYEKFRGWERIFNLDQIPT